jgi:hypothetical protein
MSIRLMALIFSVSGFTPAEKLVLLSLADYANDEGRSIYPSVDKTSRRTGLTSRSVRRIIKELVGDGFLIPVSLGGGRYRTNEFRLDVQKISQIANQDPELHSSLSGTNPDTVSSFTGNNPDMVSSFPQLNPDIVSRNPDIVSRNPDTVSPDPLLTINIRNNADVKKTSASQSFRKNGNHVEFRGALLDYFSEKTGIPRPHDNFKAANKLWTTPIYRIGELVDFDISRGQELIRLALVRLEGLTVANPNSVLKTAQSIAGELKVNGGPRQFREEVY